MVSRAWQIWVAGERCAWIVEMRETTQASVAAMARMIIIGAVIWLIIPIE